MTVYQIVLVIQACMVLLCVMSLLSLKKQKLEPEIRYLVFVYFLALITNVGYFARLLSTDYGQALAAMRIEYIGRIFIFSFIMFFGLEFCGRKVPELLWDTVLAADLIILIFMWLNPTIPGFFTRISFEIRQIPCLVYENGPVYYVAECLMVGKSVLSIWLCHKMAQQSNKIEYKRNFYRIEFAVLLLLVCCIISFLGVLGCFDLTPGALAVCSFIIGKRAVASWVFDNRHIAHASIIKNLKEPVVISDNAYRYVEANDSAIAIFPALKRLKRGDEIEGILFTILKERREGEIISDDYIFRTDVQHIIHDGKIEGYAVLLIDLTKDVQQLDEMTTLKVEAEKANWAKSEFLAKMSHEIRTPINAVLGMDEMILRESTESGIKKYAMDIKTSAQSLLGIINEILDASKIESGKMAIVNGNYHLGSLLNDLHNMMAVRAREKGLEFIFEIDEELPCEYFGDDVRIRQVLINILNNAIKYTQKGAVRMSLSGRVEGDAAVLSYAVTDTGIGIKKEDIGKMFSAYTRINDAHNRYTEGTGLGMNITVQLLRLMGSRLRVESEYGKGSTFSFDIKQIVVNEEPLGRFEDRALQSVENFSYKTGFTAPEARVLVVDDNDMNRKVFCSLLKQTKLQISQADSGFACLQQLRESQFDLIFMDHMMPEMDGIETLHAIRKEKLCEGVPIVVLTANAITGAKENYMREGFSDFLTKPMDPDKLEEMVQKHLPPALVKKGETHAEQSAEPKQPSLVEPEEFDFAYALRILREESLLRSTLEDFYRSMDGVCQKLGDKIDCLTQPEALDAYRIEVHALKSTAATVGALLLSKLARLLEMAAKEGNVERILLLHPILMEEMKKHKERLREIMPQEEEKRQLEDIQEIVPYFDMLLGALEQEEYETADFVFAQIDSYEFAGDLGYQVERLGEQIMNLSSEEAVDTIQQIKALLIKDSL